MGLFQRIDLVISPKLPVFLITPQFLGFFFLFVSTIDIKKVVWAFWGGGGAGK